jgi:hypothetical protein
MKERLIDGARSTYKKTTNAYKISIEKSEENNIPAGPRCKKRR